MSDRPTDPPAKSIADHAYTGTKIAASLLPAGSTILDAVIGPPLSRRVDAWRQAVADKLHELEARGIDLDELRDSEGFIDVVAQASRAAAYDSSEVKRTALLNGIANAASDPDPDAAAEQHAIYIRLIDELGVWHLRILDFLDDPVGWFAREGRACPDYGMMSSVDQAAKDAFPDLAKLDAETVALFYKELHARHLIGINSPMTMMTAAGWKASRSTPRGKGLLAFIRDADH